MADAGELPPHLVARASGMRLDVLQKDVRGGPSWVFHSEKIAHTPISLVSVHTDLFPTTLVSAIHPLRAMRLQAA